MTIRLLRLQYANKDTYEGWWSDDHNGPHGPGTYTWSSGVKYDGSWVNGKKHGYGMQTYPTGDKYESGWKEGQWHGYGELTRPTQGRIYCGGFSAGQENGFAIIRRAAPDGSYYEGGVRLGGYGCLMTPIGTFQGGFKFNEQDGWEDIQVLAPMKHDYSGTYNAGKMHGVGRMVDYTTGRIYD